MQNWIDLHMHSSYSIDGTYSPAELAQLCKNAGLKVVSLTDHNSTAGVAEMMEYGKKLHIAVIPGVELDCRFEDRFLHVLCYGINPSDDHWDAHTKAIRSVELAASKALMANVKNLGLDFDEEEVLALSDGGVICGEMIAEVVLRDERNAHAPLLAPYRQGGERSDNPLVNFYWDFCSPGKEAYAYIAYPPLQDVMKLVKEGGGLAVLAHPGLNAGKDMAFYQRIKESGIGGIEAYSSYHSAGEIQQYLDIAQKMDFLVTVGSDFHGKTKPAVQLAAFEIGNQEQLFYKILGAI